MFTPEILKEFPEASSFFYNAISKDRMANSYIFVGNNTDLIKIFSQNLSKILNCLNKNKDLTPCNTCLNCKWINEDKHSHAFITIEPELESKKEQIKVEKIRELINSLNITSDYYRVIFFKKSSLNCLTQECCNLLLKMVEESPEKTLFIFGNDSYDNILPTIKSRAQFINLNNLFELEYHSQLPKELEDLNPFTHKDYTQKIQDSNKIQKALNDSKLEIKDYLALLSLENYKKNKFYFKKCTEIQEELNHSFAKSQVFINSKFIIEDLYSKLNELTAN